MWAEAAVPSPSAAVTKAGTCVYNSSTMTTPTAHTRLAHSPHTRHARPAASASAHAAHGTRRWRPAAAADAGDQGWREAALGRRKSTPPAARAAPLLAL